ncbi:hypothetical protein VNI00_008075 [Paramarasmius palmivorus]|uniref:Uncharacterized protein n=1 Tax=Paramarasmius palmivorus TaxID=297713 RepID=A0AAW0D0X6_9AGAR
MQVSFSLEQLLQFAVSARLRKEDGSVGLSLNPLPRSPSTPDSALAQITDKFEGINLHFEFGSKEDEATHMVSVHASCAFDGGHIEPQMPGQKLPDAETHSNHVQDQNDVQDVQDVSSVLSLSNTPDFSSDGQVSPQDQEAWNDITALLDSVGAMQQWPTFPASLPQYTWPNNPILYDSTIQTAFTASSECMMANNNSLSIPESRYESEAAFHTGTSTPFDFGADLESYLGNAARCPDYQDPPFSQSNTTFLNGNQVASHNDSTSTSTAPQTFPAIPTTANHSSDTSSSPPESVASTSSSRPLSPSDPSHPSISTSTTTSTSSLNAPKKRRRKKRLYLQKARTDP